MHTAGFAVELRAGQERLAVLAAQLEGAAPEAGGRIPLANVVAGLDEVRVLHGAYLPAAWLLIAHAAILHFVGLSGSLQEWCFGLVKHCLLASS